MTNDMLDLSVNFERIVRVSDGTTTAHELLLRPVGGGDLVHRAALADVTMAWISAFALRTAGAVLERSPLPLHVNITPADLLEPAFVQTVADRVARADVANLVLEVTEQTPLVHRPQLEETLLVLRRLGVRFAIVDLDDGWADERSIEIVRPEIIKVRLEHLRGQVGAERARAILALAGEHHAQIVVEQVESPEDLALICQLGMTHAQGWLWTHDPAGAGREPGPVRPRSVGDDPAPDLGDPPLR